MDNEISQVPEYRSTMDRLEGLKHQSSNGVDYWIAREIHAVLGYPKWAKFEPVIERARAAFENNEIDASHHIARSGKMMKVGGGARREGVDYFLSRAACYLIAMNGDSSKPEIAAAQAYFATQTRRMERQDALSEDVKRLELRKKVSQSVVKVSGVAKEAGVTNRKQAIFHDARYHGLYGMGSRDVKARKGLNQKDNLFDHAGPLELSANEFQMNLAAEAITNEGVRGERRVIDKNREIGSKVRKVIRDSGATLPEELPLAEPIKAVRKRVESQKKKLKTLSQPTDPSTA